MTKQMPRIPQHRPRPSRRMRKMVHELELIHRGVSSLEVATDSHNAKDHDEEAVQRYQELFDLAPIGFYNLDKRGRICELNEKGARLLGFPAKWLLGKSFVVFVARQDVQRFLDLLRKSAHSREALTIDIDTYVADRTQPVQLSIKTRGKGESVLHQITAVDLSDHRRTEELLHDSLANWYSLVHNAPDTILTLEDSGRISFVNRPIWGYSVNALIGSNIMDHIPEPSRQTVLRCLEQAFKHNKRTICEIAGIGGDLDSWHSFSFGSPHPSLLGTTTTTTTTTTVMIREISEHKRTEETLRTSGEQLRDFAARLEAVREEERTRVAREIHDELGQALTALKLDLAWVESKSQGASEVRKKMKAMIAHVDQTIERVRRISSSLRPAILDDLGLIPAIEWHVSEFRKRTGIRTHLVSNADGLQLAQEASAAVFRVIQEALTNVMRHARASRVRIQLDAERRTLKVSIVDNGKGMTRTEETDLKSLGIVGMKERISRLGGDFNIVSEPGKGTRLDIIIPAPND